MNRVGRVNLDGEFVGLLEEVGTQTKFTYAAQWLAGPDARPVSLTLPLRAEPYFRLGLHPFFENLLPEGWLLEVARDCRTLHASNQRRTLWNGAYDKAPR